MIHITCQPIHKTESRKKFAQRIYEQATINGPFISTTQTEEEKWNVCDEHCDACVRVWRMAEGKGSEFRGRYWQEKERIEFVICTKQHNSYIFRLISVFVSHSLVSICMLFVVHKFWFGVALSPSVCEKFWFRFFRSSIIFNLSALCRIGHSTYLICICNMHDARVCTFKWGCDAETNAVATKEKT